MTQHVTWFICDSWDYLMKDLKKTLENLIFNVHFNFCWDYVTNMIGSSCCMHWFVCNTMIAWHNIDFNNVGISQAKVTHTTTTTVLRPFVRNNPGEPVPEETLTTHHPDYLPVFISFFHLPRSIASSLFKLHAWQSFCTEWLHNGLLLQFMYTVYQYWCTCFVFFLVGGAALLVLFMCCQLLCFYDTVWGAGGHSKCLASLVGPVRVLSTTLFLCNCFTNK